MVSIDDSMVDLFLSMILSWPRAVMVEEAFPSVDNSSNYAAKFHKSCSESFTYLSRSGQNVFYGLDITKHKVKAFLAPAPVLSIFPIAQVDCCLCDDGTLYQIGSVVNHLRDIPSSQNIIDSSGALNRSATSSKDYVWTVSQLSDGHWVFSEKRCRAIVALRTSIAVLCEEQSTWTLRIHDVFDNSSDLIIVPEPFQTVKLSFMKPTNSIPIMTAFKASTGDDDDDNNDNKDDCLNRRLFAAIFNDADTSSNLVSNEGILITFNDGEVFSFVLRKNSPLECRSLTCIHQRVVSMHRINCDTNRTSGSVACYQIIEQGLLLAGALGKLVVLYCSSSQLEGNAVVGRLQRLELHANGGAIIDLVVMSCTAFHVHADWSLWTSQLVPHRVGLHLNTRKAPMCNVSAVRLLRNAETTKINPDFTGVLFLKDGRFIIVPSIRNFKPKDAVEANGGLVVASSVKDLLTDIHQSSEHLLEIGHRHEDARRILFELSCAAHLMLSQKVRKSLKTALKANWSPAEAYCLTIDITVSNSGDFSIEGRHWHLIVTTTDGTNQRISKSTPLLKGLLASETIATSLRLTCDRPITERFLPISVTCSLQYVLPSWNSRLNSIDDELQEPFAFRAVLFDSIVDELHFLQAVDAGGATRPPPPCCHGASIEEGLWELAARHRSKAYATLLGGLSTTNKAARESVMAGAAHVGYVTLQRRHAAKILRESEETNDHFSRKLLSFLIDDRFPIDKRATVLKCSLFAQKIEFSVSIMAGDESLITIKMQVSHPAYLSPVRLAVIRKLMLDERRDEMNKPIKPRMAANSIAISRQCLADCLVLKSMVSHLLLTASEKADPQLLLVRSMYQQLRESVSSKLPFI